MTPAYLDQAIQHVFGFGERGGKTKFAKLVGVSRSAVTLWLKGERPIPGPVRLIIKIWPRLRPENCTCKCSCK